MLLGVVSALAVTGMRNATAPEDKAFLTHLEFVAGNAFVVANPAHDIVLSAMTRVTDDPEYLSLPLRIWPRGTDITVTDWANGIPEIRYFPSTGHLELPHLSESRLSRVLAEFGERRTEKKATAALLRGLGTRVEVTAVVEFARPMTSVADGGGRVLLSPARVGKFPLYWDGEPCADSEGCGDLSPVERFRRWVDGLREEDRGTLDAFGLDLAELRKAAGEGKVYGEIVEGVTPAELEKLLKDPGVRSVSVAEVGLRCASSLSTECLPVPA